MSETTETTQGQNEQSEGSRLRQELEATKAELRTLKTEKRHSVYKAAGLPEGSYDLFDEKFNGELTPEALREFGQAKGFALLNLEGESQTPDTSGEDRLEQLNSGAIPAREPSIDDRIQNAQANGDWDTFNRLSAEKLEAVRRS